MVLARLCPRWVSGVVYHPQGFVFGDSTPVSTLVYYSLALEGCLVDLFGSDHPGAPVRTGVTWVWWVHRLGQRVHLTSHAGWIQTCSDLWAAADWFEREVWEMFGIKVVGHPDLRRLVTDYGFVGYPLTKGFPVGGYLEYRYSELARRVVARPVGFTQEFRRFDFRSPWLA